MPQIAIFYNRLIVNLVLLLIFSLSCNDIYAQYRKKEKEAMRLYNEAMKQRYIEPLKPDSFLQKALRIEELIDRKKSPQYYLLTQPYILISKFYAKKHTEIPEQLKQLKEDYAAFVDSKQGAPFDSQQALEFNYNLAILDFLHNNDQESIDRLNICAHLLEKDKRLEESHLFWVNSYLALNYIALREHKMAEEYARKANTAAKLYPKKSDANRYQQVRLNYDLGILYHRTGKLKDALRMYQQALQIEMKSRTLSQSIFLGLINNTGNTLRALGAYYEAVTFHKYCAKERIKLYGEVSFSVLRTYNNIAFTYWFSGQMKAAEEYFDKSLAILHKKQKKKGIRATLLLLNLSEFYRQVGRIEDALEVGQQGFYHNIYPLDSLKNMETPSLEMIQQSEIPWYSVALLYQKGCNMAALADKREDQALLKEAYQLFEFARKATNWAREETQHRKDKMKFSELLWNINEMTSMMALKLADTEDKSRYEEDIYRFSEEARAATLAAYLSDITAEAFSSMPSDVLLEEQHLLKSIANLRSKLNVSEETQERDSLGAKIFELEESRRKLMARIRQEYPEYFDLKFRSEIPSIAQIQEQLESDKAIIEYIAYESKTYAMLITKTDYVVKVIPLTIYELDRLIRNYRRHIVNLSPKSKQSAKELYNIFLAPFESYFIDKKHLIFIVSDLISKVPMSTLIREDDSKPRYLIEDFLLSYYPSTTLMFGKKHSAKKKKRQYQFAAFAPVRFSKNKQTEIVLMQQRGNSFQDLPHSKREVETIAEMFKDLDLKHKLYLEERALEDSIKHAYLESEILHFSTHGILNETEPEKSGLVLYHNGTNAQEDGVLFLEEIFNLKLNCNLVVLGACESGLGEVSAGESLLGLSRGFMYAGVPNMVYSLWKVSDLATTKLMIHFYKHLLAQPERNAYAEALQKAKQELIASPEFSEPFFWGGFDIMVR